MNPAAVKQISECFIKPKYEVEESKQPFYLAPMDLIMLSVHYIQKGLLFTKPSCLNNEDFSIRKFLDSLKHSLSLTLVHFYPLAGRLVTQVDEEKHESMVSVDCNKGPGARFTHATLDMTMSDILSPTDVPLVVQSLFDHDRAVNYDGNTSPLLTVQVTELTDGIFIGCSINHMLVDGTSYWHFWNVWSEVHMTKSEKLSVSRPPVYKPWFPDGYGPEITLPYTHPDEFIHRYEAPALRERIFHFSAKSIARIKAQANNKESNTNNISSFKALSALCWRSIIRANRLPEDQVTNCRLAVNNRPRIIPPLPQEYFGNCINAMKTSTTVGELLVNDLGWAALLLHNSVLNHNDNAVRDHVNGWITSRYVYQHRILFDSNTVNSVMMGSSPWFEMYGNEFGLGKAVAIRSGYANKFPGKMTAYPGYELGGSVDLEICLPPEAMSALESDEEFMGAVSLPYQGINH